MTGRRLLRGLPMMSLAVFVVLIVVPMAFMRGDRFATFLTSVGVQPSPDINDGHVIAEFEDAPGDLLREVPAGERFEDARRALDIRRFSVKKVAFSRFSGVGIAPRINLVFSFEGILPNPFQTDQQFSLPVIHVYIDAPDRVAQPVETETIADIDLDGFDWDYQVIIDGFHESARVYDTQGRLVTRGLGLYVRHRTEERVFEGDKVTAGREKGQEERAGRGEEPSQRELTRITAALPMRLIGDPERGEWRYVVVVGLADLSSPSMLYPRQRPDESEIFDCVSPERNGSVNTTPDGRPRVMPLVVKNTA
jgi:hypothetical protein